jgi:hypothetical protein
MSRVLAIAVVVVGLPAYAAPTFVPLGDLGGERFTSIANGVSSDGSTVVGYATSAL